MSNIKKALVTGASRGIGKAILLELSRRGYETGLHYNRERDEAEKTAELIADLGGKCHLLQAMGEEAWAAMGGVNFLVNNAGVSYKRHFLDTTVEDMDLFMNVNFKGTVVLTQVIARKMVETATEGNIYTITSVNGVRPGLGFSAYGASKGALEIAMQGAALELAPHNIRVNTIAVGAVQTDINVAVTSNSELLKSVNEGIPLGRFGQTEEVAAVVADLLASGSYLTGSSIVLDGGLLLMRGYGKPEKYSA